MTHYSVIVLGGGTMGTAAAWELGKRGERALVLVALLVMSGLIKPALKAATVAKPVGGQLDAVVADPLTPPQPHAPLALGSPQSEKTLADARALAKQNPAAVAHIVRDWVSKDAG